MNVPDPRRSLPAFAGTLDTAVALLLPLHSVTLRQLGLGCKLPQA